MCAAVLVKQAVHAAKACCKGPPTPFIDVCQIYGHSIRPASTVRHSTAKKTRCQAGFPSCSCPCSTTAPGGSAGMVACAHDASATLPALTLSLQWCSRAAKLRTVPSSSRWSFHTPRVMGDLPNGVGLESTHRAEACQHPHEASKPPEWCLVAARHLLHLQWTRPAKISIQGRALYIFGRRPRRHRPHLCRCVRRAFAIVAAMVPCPRPAG